MTQTQPSGGRPARRGPLLAGLAVLLIAAGAIGYFVWTRPGDEIETAATGPAGSTAEVMQHEGALPEKVLGAPDAPVTIIEYSSLTCPHCANFHNALLPKLKQQYVDTGKAKYVLREFPLDNLAAAAAMLTRCMSDDRYFAFVDVLYAKQQDWAFSEGDARLRLSEIAKQTGMSEERFNQCLSDQKMLDGIMAVRERANDKFSVNSTPTFFVNGKLLRGPQTVEDFEKLMPPSVVNKPS